MTMIVIASGALVLLCVAAPRWDTGSGFLMLIFLGGLSFPVWGPVLMIVCGIYLAGMLGVLAWWCAVQAMMVISCAPKDAALDEGRIRAMMANMTDNVVALIQGEEETMQ
jgi:uncharacterized membrane protein YccC